MKALKIARSANTRYIPIPGRGFTHSHPKNGKNTLGKMYILLTQPMLMKRMVDNSINSPNAIRKMIRGAMLTLVKRRLFIRLVTISVLISDHNA